MASVALLVMLNPPMTNNPDTGGDGEGDLAEVGADPNNLSDTDGDGKIDALESILTDADGDGIGRHSYCSLEADTLDDHGDSQGQAGQRCGICQEAEAKARFQNADDHKKRQDYSHH